MASSVTVGDAYVQSWWGCWDGYCGDDLGKGMLDLVYR